jgi:hypothetical protein
MGTSITNFNDDRGTSITNFSDDRGTSISDDRITSITTLVMIGARP